MRRWVIAALGILTGMVLVVALGLIVLTQTDFGRERMRRFSLDRIASAVHGRMEVRTVSGNLLTGATLEGLSITDPAGAPFLAAERVSVTYSLRTLLSKRIYLDDVTLIEPVIVLDRPPGGQWNFARIFPSDTSARPGEQPGFGSWITVTDLTIVDGLIEVRSPWSPPEDVPPGRRASIARAALAGETRWNVVSANGGYQQIMRFVDVDAELPRLRLADPDSSDIVVEVARLDAHAYPFRPPPADVRSASGTLVVSEDSLYFRDMAVALPDTRLAGMLTWALESGDFHTELRVPRVALADLQWVRPELPEDGGGSLAVEATRADGVLAFDASDMDLALDGGELYGRAGAVLGDTVLLRDTDVRFTGVSTSLLEELVPALEIPQRGSFAGELRAAGRPEAMRVAGDVRFDATAGGVSRVGIEGTVGTGRGLRFDDVQLRLDPVRVALARPFAPSLPVGGALTGRVTLNGSTAATIHAAADVVHTDAGAVSRLVGTGEFTPPRWFDVRLRALPLALETVGRFAPGAQLRGTARGTITARGAPDDLAFAADLVFPDAGELTANGRLNLRGAQPAYTFEAVTRLTQPARVSARLPQAAFAGNVRAQGRGFEPATMAALIAADLRGVEYDSVLVDSAIVRVALRDGLATVDTLVLRTGYAHATIEGGFGLVEGRTGELSYDIVVDSLAGLSRWLPVSVDTGTVRPRPARVADVLASARADSARRADETVVQRAAAGYPPPPELQADSIPGIARDSIAGRFAVRGSASGNVERFDVRGTAELENVVLGGNAVRSGSAQFAAANPLGDQLALELEASFEGVQAAGFAFDSMTVAGRYGRGDARGNTDISIFQDDRREYRLAADFLLEVERKQLTLNDVLLRFDTTRWVSARPGVIEWAGTGIEVETIDLRSNGASRIYVDGRLPVEGDADLEVEVQGLQLAHLSALLQGDPRPSGILALDAHIAGGQRAPRLSGTFELLDGALDSTAIPDLAATFSYADRSLEATARLVDQGAPLVTAEARLPLDLAIAREPGPRLLDGPLSVDVRADSLPLQALSELVPATVDDVRGEVAGQLTVRGTFEQPEMAGNLRLALGSALIVPAGVRVVDVNGALAMAGDTVVIDSLVGYSDGGSIRVTGGLEIASLTRPTFDLDVIADEARVLNNDHARLRADARLAIEGPFDRTRITGDAAIVSGVIWVPEATDKVRIDPDDPAVTMIADTTTAERDLLPPRNELLENLVVDVNLAINRDTWVRNADANVEIYTPPDLRTLSVRAEPGSQTFRLEGFVNTDRGEYSFMGRTFELTTGSVTFTGTPELNPLLQITAEHEVKLPGRDPLAIQVIIGGTLTQPKLSLASDAQPPLTESDLISYLAFGTSSSSLLQQQGSGLSGAGSSGGALVNNVAAIATRQLTSVGLDVLLDQIERDLGGSIGADVFQIRPADVADELSFGEFGSVFKGTELEAGKYLSARLFLGLQARATAAAPGMVFEYRNPQGFRLTTSFEPRYLPRIPTLEAGSEATTTSVFGVFLRKQWRW